MDFRKLLLKIVKILNEFKIKYIITGGYAVSIWGRPRATFDIDVVAELFSRQISDVQRALQKISETAYVDRGVMQNAVQQKGEFNFIHPESGIKVDFFVKTGDFNLRRELERRIGVKIGDKVVYFISPEDLILNKLSWFLKTQSTRQLEDIESILKFQKKMDFDYLKKQARDQSTDEILEPLLKQYKR